MSSSKIEPSESSFNVDPGVSPEDVARQVVFASAFEWTVRALKPRFFVATFERHVPLESMLPAVAPAAVRAAVVSWRDGSAASLPRVPVKPQGVWKRKTELVTRKRPQEEPSISLSGDIFLQAYFDMIWDRCTTYGHVVREPRGETVSCWGAISWADTYRQLSGSVASRKDLHQPHSQLPSLSGTV